MEAGRPVRRLCSDLGEGQWWLDRMEIVEDGRSSHRDISKLELLRSTDGLDVGMKE